MPDGTKVIIAMGMLPLSTNSSVRLALKGLRDYASFKDTLRENVRFQEEHGGGGYGSANLVDQHAAERDDERNEIIRNGGRRCTKQGSERT